MERRSGMVKCVDLLNSNFDHGRGFLTIIINFGLISYCFVFCIGKVSVDNLREKKSVL